MIKLFHTCNYGHAFTRLAWSWQVQKCPVCLKEAMDRISGRVDKILRADRLRPSYPIVPDHTPVRHAPRVTARQFAQSSQAEPYPVRSLPSAPLTHSSDDSFTTAMFAQQLMAAQVTGAGSSSEESSTKPYVASTPYIPPPEPSYPTYSDCRASDYSSSSSSSSSDYGSSDSSSSSSSSFGD